MYNVWSDCSLIRFFKVRSFNNSQIVPFRKEFLLDENVTKTIQLDANVLQVASSPTLAVFKHTLSHPSLKVF